MVLKCLIGTGNVFSPVVCNFFLLTTGHPPYRFGDVHLANGTARAFAAAHILASYGWLAALIGAAQATARLRGFEI